MEEVKKKTRKRKNRETLRKEKERQSYRG